MKKRKLSPFFQLKKAIESELFDLSIAYQRLMLDGEEIKTEYALGYRAALLEMQRIARSIELEKRLN